MLDYPPQGELFPPSPPLPTDAVDLDFEGTEGGPVRIERELWTAKQRQGHSLHQISYRACFKPELPNFFIVRLTQPGERVYDPFSGRGTTAVEAALCNRRVIANDINPLSAILARPRIDPPAIDSVIGRLADLPLPAAREAGPDDPDLSAFYHPDTERELRALRDYLHDRLTAGTEDGIDRWIRMVATNRLTGHSPGFFSVYTLPPNQATTPERQHQINRRLGQAPEYRDVKRIIEKKSRQLLRDLDENTRRNLHAMAKDALFLTGRAQNTDRIPDGSVALTVTSPPFLDVVQYADDNWLRCWFNHIDAHAVGAQMSTHKSVEAWAAEMLATLQELFRITKPGGHVAFEVGEVRGGKVCLDEIIEPLGEEAGFSTKAVLINAQKFTKTSNIWGVDNNRKGTNTNRIVLFRKAG